MSTFAHLPRLREEVWRYVLCLLFSTLAVLMTFASGIYSGPGWLVLDMIIGCTGFVVIHWRRRWPMLVAVPMMLLMTVSASLAGPAVLALMSVATRRRWGQILTLLMLAVFSLTTFEVLLTSLEMREPASEQPLWAVIVASLVFFSGVVAWGLYVGSRRELLRSLVIRAESAEAEQAAQFARARADERTAIARDMHDVLAHRLSMATLHAGGLAYRADLDPDEVRASGEVIRASTHEALVELRQTLTMLREDGSEPDRPQPVLTELPALIEESRAAGMRLEEAVAVDLDAVPVSMGRTMYRVAQELLTNARKHAPGSRVDLRLQGEPGGQLQLSVQNPIAVTVADSAPPAAISAPPSGFGLIGIGERLRIAGGDFSYGPTADGRFVARASIPWPA